MKSRTLFAGPLAIGLGAYASEAAAIPEQAQGGPETIFDCHVIDEEGSYVLANDLPGSGGFPPSAGTGGIANDGDCIVLDVEKVSIEGNGFTMDRASTRFFRSSGQLGRRSACAESWTRISQVTFPVGPEHQ
jgi:hypothetical protein